MTLIVLRFTADKRGKLPQAQCSVCSLEAVLGNDAIESVVIVNRTISPSLILANAEPKVGLKQ